MIYYIIIEELYNFEFKFKIVCKTRIKMCQTVAIYLTLLTL